MEQTSQDKNPLVEHIEREMAAREWIPAELSRQSGVSPAQISRFLDGGGLAANSLYKLLNTLDFLKLDRDLVEVKQLESEPGTGETMKLTPEDLSNIIKTSRDMASGYQKDIQDLRDEIKDLKTQTTNLTDEIGKLKSQCQLLQQGLVKADRDLASTGTASSK